MLQITPQMRILVAVEAVDFRKYAPSIVMWSRGERELEKPRRASLGRPGELHIT
jgi:hypothetical protein